MSTIDISLSRKNLRLLIKHVFIGNWIMESTKVAPDKDNEEFFEAILAIGKNYNLMEGIEYNERTGRYELSTENERVMMAPIEEYQEEVFWQDLVDMLAKRDAVEKHGEAKLADLEPMERMNLIWGEEEKYDDEFEKYGINRLRVSTRG
ncbi:MAG TPA: hypothetical protein VMV44_00460 [Rectinemataceae bacterium]|nr:hypothetical protein [Rectinemataceae bacterium]